MNGPETTMPNLKDITPTAPPRTKPSSAVGPGEAPGSAAASGEQPPEGAGAEAAGRPAAEDQHRQAEGKPPIEGEQVPEKSLDAIVREAWEKMAVPLVATTIGRFENGKFLPHDTNTIAKALGIVTVDDQAKAEIARIIKAVDDLYATPIATLGGDDTFRLTNPDGTIREIIMQQTTGPVLKALRGISEEKQTSPDGQSLSTDRAQRARQIHNLVEPTVKGNENDGYWFDTEEPKPKTEQEKAIERIGEMGNAVAVGLEKLKPKDITDPEARLMVEVLKFYRQSLSALDPTSQQEQIAFLSSGVYEVLKNQKVINLLSEEAQASVNTVTSDRNIAGQIESVKRAFLEGSVARILGRHFKDWTDQIEQIGTANLHRDLGIALTLSGLPDEQITVNLNQYTLSTAEENLIRVCANKDLSNDLVKATLERMGIDPEKIKYDIENLKKPGGWDTKKILAAGGLIMLLPTILGPLSFTGGDPQQERE